MQSHPAFAAKTFVGPTKRFSPLCPPLKTVPAWEAPRLWWNIFSTFEPAHTILTIQTLVEGRSAIFHFHFWQPFGSAKCSPCFWQISFTSMGPFFLQIMCSIYFWISDVKSQQQYKFQKGLIQNKQNAHECILYGLMIVQSQTWPAAECWMSNTLWPTDKTDQNVKLLLSWRTKSQGARWYFPQPAKEKHCRPTRKSSPTWTSFD